VLTLPFVVSSDCITGNVKGAGPWLFRVCYSAVYVWRRLIFVEGFRTLPWGGGVCWSGRFGFSLAWSGVGHLCMLYGSYQWLCSSARYLYIYIYIYMCVYIYIFIYLFIYVYYIFVHVKWPSLVRVRSSMYP